MKTAQPNPANIARRVNEMFARARHLHAQGKHEKADNECQQLLKEHPEHAGALHLRVIINRELNRLPQAERLLTRLEGITGAENTDVLYEWGVLLFYLGRTQAAVNRLNALLEKMPTHANGHMVLGRIYDRLGLLNTAETHLRRALELRPVDETLCKDLAAIYERLGLFETGIHYARRAYNLNPKYLDAILIWAKLEEARGDLKRAEELIDFAQSLAPSHPLTDFVNAHLQRRQGNFEQALSSIESLDLKRLNADTQAMSWQERGFCLERLQRFDEAFAAFSEMSTINRRPPINRNYPESAVREELDTLREYWESVDTDTLAQAKPLGDDEPKPIFILGFPRSGTTLAEQILSSHPEVIAGDETHALDMALGHYRTSREETPLLQASRQLVGDNAEAYVTNLRQNYQQRIRHQAILEPGTLNFTDKTPLNETHMGLIASIFPDAPMLHLIRHPLNVVLSSFFNDVRHGRGFATRLETTAIHYALTMDMVELYTRRLNLRYLPVRYEDIVNDQEMSTRKLIEFIDLPWNEKCLNFHENDRHVRTASATQVKEKLYTRSLDRYKPFLKHLEPVIPVLEPYITRLGYEI